MLADQLLAPVPGGTARYTRELTTALAATAPKGWEVTTVTARHPDPSHAAIPNVAPRRPLPLSRRALSLAWELGLPLWPGADAVHAPTPLAPRSVPAGRSLVVTVHDTVPWTHPRTLSRRGASWHRRMIRAATRSASGIVVPTKAVRTDLNALFPHSTPITVIGEGVTDTLSRPPTDAPTLATRLNLPDAYVLIIGTIEPRKGHADLINAMTGVPDVPLVVAGPQGWGGVDPAAIARTHGLSPHRLRILGPLSDPELATTLHRSTVVVLPSAAEGFGLPLLEAMAAGIPVIHSDAPALIEVADGAGITVPHGDVNALTSAICDVLAHPRRVSTLVATGKRVAAGHRWRDAARAVWGVHLRRFAARHEADQPVFD